MKTAIAALLMLTAFGACAASEAPDAMEIMKQHEMHLQMKERMSSEPLKLKDGSYLFINEDGTMRMVDRQGKPVMMHDGVEMELEDGSVVVMEHGTLQRHDHRATKN